MDQESREPGAASGPKPGPAGTAPPEGEPAASGLPREPARSTRPPWCRPRRTPTTQSEQEELERLRAEVRELRGRAAAGAAPGRPSRRGGRWRAPVASVCIVLACVLAPVSVLGVWAANQVSNTDRYVANVAPLIHEPVDPGRAQRQDHRPGHQQA